MSEICDICDIRGCKTGKLFNRGKRLKPDEYQLGTVIWIYNSLSQILIQKRSKTKSYLPDTWATHGGGVSAGETSLQACIREAQEEIGLKVLSHEINFLCRSIEDNFIIDYYITEQEFDVNKAILQKDEVSEIKWVSVLELQQMKNNSMFFGYPEFNKVIDYIKSKFH